MSITTALLRRIPNRFHSKLTTADKLIPFFKDGMYMGWSGFTGVGYPKIMPTVLADHVEKNGLQGKLKFNLFVGASTGAETEDRWAKLDMIDRRYPHQVGKNIQKGINSGRIRFADKHLSMFPQHLQAGFYTKHRTDKKILDIAIVEATAIKSDGSIIAGASVGTTPEIIQAADKVIIEVNTRLPSFEGLHDIVLPELPPKRKAFAINQVDDRIGSVSIPCDPEKVIAILESDRPDNTTPNEEQDEGSIAIANHIIAFLQHEVSKGRLPKSLLPLQSGIGNIANAIIGGMSTGPFEDTYVWTEVLQDTFLDFFDQGKLTFASATSVRFSPQGFEKFYNNWDKYSHKLILRPQQISNAPEIIRRLGVIAMNTPVEFDIYGHANSTMVSGSRMINGLGGSGDFLRNAYISIMHAPSARPSKNDPFGISTVVPMATHVDQTEHDLDVYVTEQGLADLRGMSPRERALEIINKCAHPVYKPILKEYFTYAEKKCLADGTGHEPHILDNVFDMHKNLRDKGTMRLDAWKFAK